MSSYIEALSDQFINNLDLSTAAEVQIFPTTGSEVLFGTGGTAGGTSDYRCDMTAQFHGQGASGSTVAFRIVFNEGDANEQSFGDTAIPGLDQFRARAQISEYVMPLIVFGVTLENSITHAVKVYARTVDGGQARFPGSSVAPAHPVKVSLTKVS